MSLTQEPRELTEEEIKELVNEILKNPDKYPDESKLLLMLKVTFRRSGCGYVYLYRTNVRVLYGEVDEVVLYRSEFNCDVEERIVVIPKTVGTVLLVEYRDDNPEVTNRVSIYVFTGSEWKSVEFPIPK